MHALHRHGNGIDFCTIMEKVLHINQPRPRIGARHVKWYRRVFKTAVGNRCDELNKATEQPVPGYGAAT